MELYPGSSTLVDRNRFEMANKDKSSYTFFVSHILTAIASVKDCYKKNLRGRSSTKGDKSKRKQAFSTYILDEIYKAVDYHYSSIIKLRKEFEIKEGLKITKPRSQINKTINDKLLAINQHLEIIRFGNKSKGKLLSEEDLLGFKMYESYNEDLKLFDVLDKEIENEISKAEIEKSKGKLGLFQFVLCY